MKAISYQSLAAVCLVTLAAAGCGRSPGTSPVTGPEAPAVASVSDELDDMMAEGVEKVTICHIPPGNPENMHTIIVGAPAVAAHIENHGDYVGECVPQCGITSPSGQLHAASCNIGR